METEEHPHVHFRFVPRMADMPNDRRSVYVFNYLGVSESERVSEVTMNEIAR